MTMTAVRDTVRMRDKLRLLPPRLRRVHLKALIRHEAERSAKGSTRTEALSALLRDQSTAAPLREGR